MAQFRPEDDQPLAEVAHKSMYYVYLLKSLLNDKSYVGYTSKSPVARLKEHNRGVSKFTKNNMPWKLVYYEVLHCKKCAMEREKFYKVGVGKKIKKMILANI